MAEFSAGSGTGPRGTDTLSGIAAKAKDKASGVGQMAGDALDHGRETAAGGLKSAATALHERADTLPGGQKVSSAAHTTADALSSTADYIRQKDLKGMVADVQELVKRNPGPALLTAAVLGFLVARSLSRDGD